MIQQRTWSEMSSLSLVTSRRLSLLMTRPLAKARDFALLHLRTMTLWISVFVSLCLVFCCFGVTCAMFFFFLLYQFYYQDYFYTIYIKLSELQMKLFPHLHKIEAATAAKCFFQNGPPTLKHILLTCTVCSDLRIQVCL